MRLATVREGSLRDGRLVAVSADHARCAPPPDGPRTLQEALEEWERWSEPLAEVCRSLDDGADLPGARPCAEVTFESPLPRAYLWAEGSTYLTHMRRCRLARGAEMPAGVDRAPVVYQAGSDRFLGPRDDIPIGDADWGLDLEATLAVVVDDVARGTGSADALGHVKLVVLVNDLTLRNLLPEETARRVGLFRCKPSRPCAPVAVSPDALGAAWADGLLAATVVCQVRGELLGRLRSEVDAAFGFGELIEHMTTTRSLAAGSVIGSGTVSNEDESRGFGCLAELRATELAGGAAEPELTGYLAEGDHLRVEAYGADGRSVFGAIENAVTADG